MYKSSMNVEKYKKLCFNKFSFRYKGDSTAVRMQRVNLLILQRGLPFSSNSSLIEEILLFQRLQSVSVKR